MRTVADQFAEILAAAGVKRIYGIIGDSLHRATCTSLTDCSIAIARVFSSLASPRKSLRARSAAAKRRRHTPQSVSSVKTLVAVAATLAQTSVCALIPWYGFADDAHQRSVSVSLRQFDSV